MPLISGRRTSNMRQSALREWFEFKNSSAEANRFTSRPADLISLCSDLRTEISSSTTETRDILKTSRVWITCGGRRNLLHLGVVLQIQAPLAGSSPRTGSKFVRY